MTTAPLAPTPTSRLPRLARTAVVELAAAAAAIGTVVLVLAATRTGDAGVLPRVVGGARTLWNGLVSADPAALVGLLLALLVGHGVLAAAWLAEDADRPTYDVR